MKLPSTGMMTRGPMLQSSLELLIMLSFGIIILLPIVMLAFVQMASSSATLYTGQAQSTADKLASVAAQVAAQGPPTQVFTSVQVPQNVHNIYVGNLNNTVGRQIVFVIETSAGMSYVTAYSLVNVSGNLSAIESASTYLVNVSAQASCPSQPSIPCVYMAPVLPK